MLTHAPTMKFLRWALCLLLLCCSSLPVLAPSPDGGVSAIDRDALATDAYRNGDFKNLSTARVLWSDELADPSLADEAGKRARLCYNLGTLCLREGKNMEAVAWFSAALRLRPRDADTWANLEVARLNAGLDVADRGDLKASVEQLLNSLTKQESSLLALFGLLPLALALAYEALRGGTQGPCTDIFQPSDLDFGSRSLGAPKLDNWSAGFDRDR
jgi:tetratricopeptide (TPR) repeat protein